MLRQTCRNSERTMLKNPTFRIIAVALVVMLGFALYKKWIVETHMNAAFLAQGMATAANLKVAVIEYYQDYGEMPSSNNAMGMADPVEIVGQALRTIEVIDGGLLLLTYGEESGVDQGKIYLTPNPGDLRINSWTCTTPSYPKIQKLIPQCRFVPAT